MHPVLLVYVHYQIHSEENYWQDIKFQLCHRQTTAQKTCHSISIALVSGQGREQCETAGFSATPYIFPSKTIACYFCRSLWLLVSHPPQLSPLLVTNLTQQGSTCLSKRWHEWDNSQQTQDKNCTNTWSIGLWLPW